MTSSSSPRTFVRRPAPLSASSRLLLPSVKFGRRLNNLTRVGSPLGTRHHPSPSTRREPQRRSRSRNTRKELGTHQVRADLHFLSLKKKRTSTRGTLDKADELDKLDWKKSSPPDGRPRRRPASSSPSLPQLLGEPCLPSPKLEHVKLKSRGLSGEIHSRARALRAFLMRVS